MSYNTDPNNVINRVSGEFTYISNLNLEFPKVFAALESHCGIGETISYCDNPTKNSKSAMITDISIIEDSLTKYTAYGGFGIHDWVGWRELSPVSNNTEDPLICEITALHQGADEYRGIRISKNTLHLTEKYDGARILIVSLEGRIMMNERLVHPTLELDFLSKGVYQINVITGDSDTVRRLKHISF
jgi:hypothetical protein